MDFKNIENLIINGKQVVQVKTGYNGIIYPFIDLEINCIWNDSNNNDGFRPSSLPIASTVPWRESFVIAKWYELNSSNNWSVTDRVPMYDYDVSCFDINGYTYSVSQTDYTFNVTYTHNIETMDIPISLTSTVPNMNSYNVDLVRNNVTIDSKLFIVDNPSQQYFYDVPVYYNQGQIAYYVPVPTPNPSYNISVSGNMQSGFNISINPILGTMNIQIVVDVSMSYYPTDIESLQVEVTDTTTGEWVQTLDYNDFTVTPYGNDILLTYSSSRMVGEYTVECTNADSIIRDCVLDSSSHTSQTSTISEGDTTNYTLGLIYVEPPNNLEIYIGAYIPSGSSHSNDIENIQVLIRDASNITIESLTYSDFDEEVRGGWHYLTYSTMVSSGQYSVVCANASNLISDCTLDSSSILDVTDTVSTNEVTEFNLGLIYNLS